MKKRFLVLLTLPVLVFSCGRPLKDGTHTLTVLSTNDIHGTWFDSTYVGSGVRPSIMAIHSYIDSVRKADGADNVILLDAGDCLQGDNAPYYFNYIDTVAPHLFPRLVQYMQYDAIAMGNHDIETGHAVYDRVQAQLVKAKAPFLAGNAIRNDNGEPYFPLYKVIRRAGLKIVVLGYNNANIAAWLGEEIWSGMHFVSIAQIIQQDVDAVRAKEHPDVVIAAMHSACGQGDGRLLEAEALDVFNSVRGVDWVVCGHDHRPYVEARDTMALLNSGSHSRFLAHGKMHVTVADGQITDKSFEADLIPVRPEKADPRMRARFRKDFEAVRAFTLQEVGVLNTTLRTRDAYAGMCDYMNLLHSLSLSLEDAEISLAAPLTYNGTVQAGVLVFNDLFTIYPFENQLYIVNMSGDEIRRYLEVSYDNWINTVAREGDHILKIAKRDDPRTLQAGWSFENRAYNFDSAGGINYTVDVTKPAGRRISIASMADGRPFDPARMYKVAMTSYRASGGGDLLKAVGIDGEARTVRRYPEIRKMLYDYLMKNGSIDPEEIGDAKVVGRWRFVPEKIAGPAMKADMALLFKD